MAQRTVVKYRRDRAGRAPTLTSAGSGFLFGSANRLVSDELSQEDRDALSYLIPILEPSLSRARSGSTDNAPSSGHLGHELSPDSTNSCAHVNRLDDPHLASPLAPNILYAPDAYTSGHQVIRATGSSCTILRVQSLTSSIGGYGKLGPNTAWATPGDPAGALCVTPIILHGTVRNGSGSGLLLRPSRNTSDG
ncbi:hypothetical protein BC834DRAFT_845411 [Gloeopeniophorella convolvens]|nr:hypothetical protein BC834DRAFT_845411 [Gloeopeniophorella convolvens]